MEKKIGKLDEELRKYKDQMAKMKEGPSKVCGAAAFACTSRGAEHGEAAGNARAEAEEDVRGELAASLSLTPHRYEQQMLNLQNQSFNMEQANYATQTIKDTKMTVRYRRRCCSVCHAGRWMR